MHADVVVVGAGTAGSVLAARLSEDPDRRVVLIEAGPVPDPRPPALLDARRVPGAEPDGAWNRWFPVRLTAGRDWAVSRGRVAGGSSATNGAYFVRPRSADLLDWSGGSGPWTPTAVLPLLRDLERDLDLGASDLHGDRGPVPVSRGALDHPAAAALVEAAVDRGHPFEQDLNGAADRGVGAMPANAADGVRWSAADTHLRAALGRPNLRVLGGTAVDRVLVRHLRAVGVAAGDGVVEADLVVLAAGALTSPALLLRSGIGPAAALRAAGVAVVLDAPGVGAQLSDHPQSVVEARPAGVAPADGWAGALLHLPADDGGDLEVLQSLVPMGALTRQEPRGGPLALLVSAQVREAPGSLTLEPDGRMRIEQGYLRTAADRGRLRQGVREAVALLGADVVAPPPTGDDRQLDRWIQGHLGTALHTCSTAPWRLPDGSPGPVDELGRVRGVDGLVVADTSILPTAPSRGPAATAFLIGEMIAAHLRRR